MEWKRNRWSTLFSSSQPLLPGPLWSTPCSNAKAKALLGRSAGVNTLVVLAQWTSSASLVPRFIVLDIASDGLLFSEHHCCADMIYQRLGSHRCAPRASCLDRTYEIITQCLPNSLQWIMSWFNKPLSLILLFLKSGNVFLKYSFRNQLFLQFPSCVNLLKQMTEIKQSL